MKNSIMLFVILSFLFTARASATFIKDTLPLFDSADAIMFNLKAKKQATTGIVLLSGGIVLAVTGYGLAMASLGNLFDASNHKDYGNLPEILGFGGLALVATGIGLLIAAKRNKRKARIILSNQNWSLPRQPFNTKGYLKAGLVINF